MNRFRNGIPYPDETPCRIIPDFDMDALAEVKALGWLQLTNGDLETAKKYAAQQFDDIAIAGWMRAVETCHKRGIAVQL